MITEREKNFTLTDNGTAGPKVHAGGSMTVTASGTWGSGSLAIKMNSGAGQVTVYTMTADEVRVFDFPPNAAITFVLTGATSPSLTIEVR